MLYKRFKRTLDIEMPVSDTIETADNNGWVADGTRYLKSVLIVFATAFVVGDLDPLRKTDNQRLPGMCQQRSRNASPSSQQSIDAAYYVGGQATHHKWPPVSVRAGKQNARQIPRRQVERQSNLLSKETGA